MSTSPSQTLASRATRRVTFFDVSDHLKGPLGKPRTMAMADASSHKSAKSTEREKARQGENALQQKSSAISPVAARDSSSAMVGCRDTRPVTPPQPTGDARSTSPSCQSFPGACQHEKTEWPSANRITTALEFPLEDTPLANTMRPPVWRESLPSTTCRGHNFPDHFFTSSRQVTRVSGTRDSSSTRGRHLYTDVEREILDRKRRHVLVQHFFTSHEDAVRLYIRLDQLSRYRDFCEVEFRERRQVLRSEEAKLVPQASACGGHAMEPPCDIKRLQAALANVAATSPELARAWDDLRDSRTPLPSLPSSHQAATAKHSSHIHSAADIERAGGTRAHHVGRSLNEGSSATTKKAGGTNSPIRGPAVVSQASGASSISAVRGTGGSYSFAESSKTFTANESAKQSQSSQPRTALEAWRSARKGGVLSAEPSPTASAGATRSRGFTPSDSTAASHPTHTFPAAAPEVVVEIFPTAEAKRPSKRPPPLSSPRKEATPSAGNDRQRIDAAMATPPRCCVIDSACVSTPRSGLRGSLSWLQEVSSLPDLASPPPQLPSSPYPTRNSVAVVASREPQRRSGITLLRSKGLVDTPDRRSPVRTKGSPTSSSMKDSPLARYRAKNGFRGPASHSHSRPAGVLSQTSSAVHSSPQQATVTGERSGVMARGKDEGSTASPRASDAAKNGTLRGVQIALVQQRQRLGRLRAGGRLDAAQDTCTSAPSERIPASAALGTAHHGTADATSRSFSTSSLRPTAPSERTGRLPFEKYSSFSTSAESSSSHSQGSDVPAMGCTPSHPIAASTVSPSHRLTSASHSAPSAAQHWGANPPAASASVSSPPSAALPRIGAAASARTGSPMPAMNWNGLSETADVVGSRLPSRDTASSSPADFAAESIVADWRRSAADLRLPEEPQEVERNVSAASAALLRGTAREISSELHMHGSSSTCDVIAVTRRRVGDLGSCTTKRERNDSKRTVLEGIRALKVYVNVVEERTALLERQSGASSLHIGWHQS